MTRPYTPAQIEDMNLQYSPRLTVPDAEDYLQKSAEMSARARDRLNGQIDIIYGDSAGQKLDIFPAANKHAPVHVFIHGGYWRALDKDYYSHVA